MGTLKRRARRRQQAPNTLTAFWDAGQPPPAWAGKPGDHIAELEDLNFFGSATERHNGRHPHWREWWNCYEGATA